MKDNAGMSLSGSSREFSMNFSRRTATDDIFDKIYDDIMTLALKPGSKLSEVEVAKQFEVSRQPVREAFIRLSNMGLLVVRPQRATIVRKISRNEVSDARFIRAAVEVEVVRAACGRFNDSHRKAFEENLEKQKQTLERNDPKSFSELDVEFHKLLFACAGSEMAYKTIHESKAQVDRLCAMSLSEPTEHKQVYEDHVQMYDSLKRGDVDGIVALMRKHLSRLDSIIEEVSLSNEDFFED